MTFRYVTHANVPDYIRCGWLATPALDGTHHGFYSVLMVWLCACNPPAATPIRQEQATVRAEGRSAVADHSMVPA